MTLTFNFRGQTWNLIHLSQKWSDSHETKSKHTDWTLGLKCDHRVWPWLWPWPWIFKVKHGICYISAQNGPIATKRKANISIELTASNVTIRFDLGHDLDLDFSMSNMQFAISQPKIVQLPQNEKQTYRLNFRPQKWPSGLTLAMTLNFELSNSYISEWEGRLTLNKGSGSRSFMTMTTTIWWPRSVVRIYHIVPGATSDVDVPSTRLVIFYDLRFWFGLLKFIGE